MSFTGFSQKIALRGGFESFGSVEGEIFPGMNLGMEAQVTEKRTLSTDFSQGFGPISKSGSSYFNSYTFKAEGRANSYFKEALKGFHFGAGAFYANRYYRFDETASNVNVGIEPRKNSVLSAGLISNFGYSTVVRNLLVGFEGGLGLNFNSPDAFLTIGLKLGYVL